MYIRMKLIIAIVLCFCPFYNLPPNCAKNIYWIKNGSSVRTKMEII